MRTKVTILVADDDLDDQDLLQNGLAQCKVNIEIVPVFDGVKVMDYLWRRGDFKHVTSLPDLLLLDLNMPLMDGFQTIKEIKRFPHLRSIPIYVITTSRSPSHMSKALHLGASGFYSKGFKASDILDILRKVCRDCFESVPELEGE